MNEMKGDLWNHVGHADAIGITTNGTVKKDGAAVMGKGIAKQALDRFPGIDRRLAAYLTQYGNRPAKLTEQDGTWICSFPTKAGPTMVHSREEANTVVVEHMRDRFRYPAEVPGWAMRSDLLLIEQSARHLVEMADKFGWKSIIIPAPGSGNGELAYADVRAVLAPILDDRFTIITYG